MKNTALVTTNPSDDCSLSENDIKTLVSVGTIPAGTPSDVVVFFAKTCATMKMSPFKRQIHLIKRNSKQGARYSIQVGIDGLRARADATGHYAGNDDYVFDNGLNQFQMIDQGFTTPETATATVYKVVGGVRCPFSATAAWKSYCPQGDGESFMWRKMSFLMLGKTAEALALRKAFPNETSGVFTEEEMAHVPLADDAVQSMTAEPVTVVTTARRKPEPKVSEPESRIVNAEVVSGPKADKPTSEPLPTVTDWRSVNIHYGKHKGKKLGGLEQRSLRWFWQTFQVEKSYEKDGKTIPLSEANIATQKIFRAALNAAGNEFEFVEEPTE